MPTNTTASRAKPTTAKPRKAATPPMDNRLKAVLGTKPAALDDQFARDGEELLFRSKSGAVLRLSLDPEIGLLDEALDLDTSDMDSADLKRLLDLLFRLAGEDARHLRTRTEMVPVFDRWCWELSVAMNGVSFPESEGSATA